MAKYMTTSTLIDSVKRRAMIPETQQTFQEADFLAFANEELDIGIIPHVLSYHQDFFLHTELVPIIPNQSRYQLPSRAVGNKLREVAYQDTSGNIFEMSRIGIGDLPSYQNNVIQNSFTLFYIEGSELVLVPETGSSPIGSIRFSYYLRPNELVDESRVAIVTGINFTTGDISVASVPTNITLGQTLDIIQTKDPHETMSLDVYPTAINSITKVISFNPSDLPPKLAIGDHIALSGETIVPQVPSDLHSMLAQRVAARCLEALGDMQGLQSANAKLSEMEVKTGMIIDNRVEDAPQKIVNKHSMLKRKKLYWRY